MATSIDSRSVVHPEAVLGEGVEIGPFCFIGAHVRLGDGCRLLSHCRIDGPSVFGANNVFYPFSVLGMDTPDKKYRGEAASLEVGNDNTFREHVTVHRGTANGGSITRIGNDNLLMPSAHVAHDCSLGDGNVMTNFAGLAGHCQLGDHVTLAAYTGVHQECSVGSYAFVGMHSTVKADVLPFISVQGDPARYIGVNNVGMARHGKSHEEMKAVKTAARLLVKGRVRREKALVLMDDMADKNPLIALMASFTRDSQRGLVRA